MDSFFESWENLQRRARPTIMDPMVLFAAAIALSLDQGASNISIIPEPVSVRVPIAGKLAIPENASVRAPRKWQAIREAIVTTFAAGGNGDRPTFLLLERESLKPEEYRLRISADGVQIEAKTDAGAFYALQSLLQLRSDRKELPYVEIHDSPRFGYRGLMVDVARHFWKVEDLEKYIDVMAMYKFNRLHLHLTDDQGWRIELPNWPKLKEVASRRKETNGDKKPHGGSYTKSDLKEIVAYAAARQIQVVPEVELPGHVTALLAAYPDLACFPKDDFETATEPGVYEELVCPAKSRVFQLYRDVFRLLGEVFPGEIVHLGGHEVPLDRWRKCPNCADLRTKEKLADPEAQLAWLLRQMTRALPPGKRPMFWYEEAVGQYPSPGYVTSWKTGRTPIDVTQAAHSAWPILLSPPEHAYFDYPQAKDDVPKVGWMPVTSLAQTYSLDPGFGLPPESQKHTIGVEGLLWGDYVETLERAFYMTYPRALALSEACWSPPEVRSWDNFRRKAKIHATQFKAMGIDIGPVP